MRPHYYILDGEQVVPAAGVLAWGHWFETADRRVRQTHVRGHWISTVFVGMDMSIFAGEPEVFETGVFRIVDDETGERIDGSPQELFEKMAVHFGQRAAKAVPDANVESAAATGARLGMAFMASLLEGALDQRQPSLFTALLVSALRQRDAWNLGDMCAVRFVDMTPRPGEQAH